MPTARRAGLDGLLLLPGALIIYTAFHGGGFFAGTQGGLAVLLAVLLLLRVTLAEHPFAGAGRLLAVAAGCLALLLGWILISASWSDSPARALLEYNRGLLYLLALLLFGTLPMTTARLRVVLVGVAAAAIVVCAVALITRVLPDVWPVSPNVANDRLSYPITYWNSLGLLGALGAVLCVHFTCSEREPAYVRVVAAAALPILAATIYLTFSRAAIAIAPVAVLAYLILARPRAALSGVLASIPATAVAVVVTYHADLLATERPTTRAAVDQGHDVAMVIALCVVAAAVLRALGLWLDARIVARPARVIPRRILAASLGGLAVLTVLGFVVAGGPGYVSDRYDTFVHRTEPKETGDLRSRLTDPSSNGRIDEWRVATDAWEASRLHGAGAGTYQNLWNRDRPYETVIVDGHSLYAEVLGELGIVGLLLTLGVIVTLLAGTAMRIRGPDRAVYAAALAVLGTWALRAGLDWDWEMPVVTLWVFFVGGAVLATPRPGSGLSADEEERRLGDPPRMFRVVVALGCLLVAITPFHVAKSQSHLDAAVRAYNRGDCNVAIDEALASLEAEQVRPEPRLVLTYCDLRLGQPTLALRQIQAAVKRDPDNWKLHYVLAINRALLGRNPKPELRKARQLNPLEPIVKRAIRRFRKANTPKKWQRRAQRARLPGV